MGTPEERLQLFLFDFGLCRRIRDSSNLLKTPRKLTYSPGTPFYMSLGAHTREQGPSDDLLAWLYSFLECVAAHGLPWSRCCNSSAMMRRKREVQHEGGVALVRDLPVPHHFLAIYRYLETLDYADLVDYNFVQSLLDAMARDTNTCPSAPFDWD